MLRQKNHYWNEFEEEKKAKYTHTHTETEWIEEDEWRSSCRFDRNENAREKKKANVIW